MIETFLIIQFICLGFIAATWDRDLESPRIRTDLGIEGRKKAEPEKQDLIESEGEMIRNIKSPHTHKRVELPHRPQ